MKIRAVGMNVIIRRDEKLGVTKGGIHIPEQARDSSTMGTVASTGDGRVTEQGVVVPPPVKAGDRVIFPIYAGTPIKVNGQEYTVMNENEIMAVVE